MDREKLIKELNKVTEELESLVERESELIKLIAETK